MAVLIRPRQWGQTPPGPSATIATGHPLARGLQFALLPTGAGFAFDRLTRRTATTNITGGRPDALVTGASDFIEFAARDDLLAASTGFAMAGRFTPTTINTFNPLGLTASQGGVADSFDNWQQTGSAVWNVFRGDGNGGAYVQFSATTPAALAANTTVTRVCSFTDNLRQTTPLVWAATAGTPTPCSVSKSGASTGAVGTNARAVRVGRRADGATQFTGAVHWLYAWVRPLLAEEVAWLNAEPFAFIAPAAPRVSYFAIEATTTISGTGALTGGGGTLAGAGTFTISGTGALTGGGGTIAAAGAETISGTATLASGGGTLAGAGTETISGTAALASGGGTLEAAGTLTISGTAALASGGGTLSAFDFSVPGSATLVVALTGAATLTVAPTGTATLGVSP